MKRIKSLNGYTIYQAISKRDENNGFSVGEYYIYFSSDIRDYGLSNSYPEYDGIDSIDIAIELCNGNFAIAKEICESDNTCVSYDEIESVEKLLNSGVERETIENGDELTFSTIYNVVFDGENHFHAEIRKGVSIRDVHEQIIYHWHCDGIKIHFLHDEISGYINLKPDSVLFTFDGVLFCGDSLNLDEIPHEYEIKANNLLDFYSMYKDSIQALERFNVEMLNEYLESNHYSDSKTFNDFLNACEWFDGELIINGVESNFGFVWNSDYIFTEYGKKEFSLILESKDFSIDGNCIELNAESGEQYNDLFLALCSGYVSDSYYNKCIEKKGV